MTVHIPLYVITFFIGFFGAIALLMTIGRLLSDD